MKKAATLLTIVCLALYAFAIEANAYVVPQYTVTQADRSRLQGNSSQQVSNEVNRVAASGAQRSIRRYMSPVRNQGNRGTCSAFAAMALIEYTMPSAYSNLSEQCLVYFSTRRDPGWISQRVDYMLSKGVFLESSCPYSNNASQIPSNINQGNPDLLVGGGVYYLGSPSINSLQTVKNQINRGAPVGLSVWVSTQDFYNNSSSVIIRHPSNQNNICLQSSECGGHAVVITGYNDNNQTLEIKNSWGTSWKDGGYGRMTYEYFLKNYMSGQPNELVTVQ